MTAPKRSGLLLPLLGALLMGAVVLDVIRRTALRTGAERVEQPAAAPVAGDSRPIRDDDAEEPGAPPPRSSGATSVAGSAAAARDDHAPRRAVRERLAREGAGTYLADWIAGSDSLIRRWSDERIRQPLRVAVVRAAVDGFREEFVSNVAWAVGRWNGALLPVQMRIGGDTAGADITVTWIARHDSSRTGRADVTWDNVGRIHRVVVVLATHEPRGRLLDGSQMVALALHELGHALGLGHSPVPADALYPETRAVELTERDRRTARLLYALPPGSIREGPSP